jgi:hypothetical protein
MKIKIPTKEQVYSKTINSNKKYSVNQDKILNLNKVFLIGDILLEYLPVN